MFVHRHHHDQHDHHDRGDHDDNGDHEEVGSYMRKLEVVQKEVGGCLISYMYNLQQGSWRLSGKLTMNEPVLPYVGIELLWQLKNISIVMYTSTFQSCSFNKSVLVHSTQCAVCLSKYNFNALNCRLRYKYKSGAQ